MSRVDYEAVKGIINHIIGDTQQGNVLLKAIKGYFRQKDEIKVVRYISEEKDLKSTFLTERLNSAYCGEAEKAMDKYTKKLIIENAKLRKTSQKKNCSTTS